LHAACGSEHSSLNPEHCTSRNTKRMISARPADTGGERKLMGSRFSFSQSHSVSSAVRTPAVFLTISPSRRSTTQCSRLQSTCRSPVGGWIYNASHDPEPTARQSGYRTVQSPYTTPGL
jgi:hypothetical protein